MHDEMGGFYEVRVHGGGKNHCLFCLLQREVEDLGGSSIVVIDGLSKPPCQAAAAKDYKRAPKYRREFDKRRTVLQ